MHIQTILALVNHKDANHVMRYEWANWKLCFHFRNECIQKILEDPLKNCYPKVLTENDLKQLAMRVKRAVTRKSKAESVLATLEERLQGLTYRKDIKDRTWQSYSWCYKFHETYVQEILYQPLLSPEDITDEKLNDLEKQLLEKKMTKKS